MWLATFHRDKEWMVCMFGSWEYALSILGFFFAPAKWLRCTRNLFGRIANDWATVPTTTTMMMAFALVKCECNNLVFWYRVTNWEAETARERVFVQCRGCIVQSKNVSSETECNRDKFKLRSFDTSNVRQKTVNMYFDKQRANAIWTLACWQAQSVWPIHLFRHIIESICWICDFIVCGTYTHKHISMHLIKFKRSSSSIGGNCIWSLRFDYMFRIFGGCALCMSIFLLYTHSL